jgi:hypothetical protein
MSPLCKPTSPLARSGNARAGDPADPDPVQRTDAAAIPPHRAARRHGHLDDGRPTGGDLATTSGDDWTARAAGATSLLQRRAAVPRDRVGAARPGRPLRGGASLRRLAQRAQGAHFGRFLTMLEDYRALAADDASFAPARPAVVNPYVRVPRDLLGVAAANGPAAPDDPFGVHLIQDRYPPRSATWSTPATRRCCSCCTASSNTPRRPTPS